MKKALLKDSIKEIKNTYKRFISILLMAFLGVGFFAGIRAASPDMLDTLDQYYKKQNVYDIEIISTLGLTDGDIEAISQIENIEKVEASFETDGKIEIEGKENIVKLITLGEINKPIILEGNVPTTENECLVEQSFLTANNKKIGDTINVEVETTKNDNGEEIQYLKNSEMKIVGTAKSPLYISRDRGTSGLGAGKVNYYIYMLKENVNTSIYTKIYVKVKDSDKYVTSENNYEDYIEEVKNNIEEIKEERENARKQGLIDIANQKITDAENELNNQKQEAENKIADAENELSKAREEIQNGENEISQNKKSADTEFTNAQKQIDNAKLELENKEKELNTKEEQLNKQYEQLGIENPYSGEIQKAKEEIQKAKKELEQQQTELNNTKNTTYEKIENAQEELDEAKKKLEDGENELENSKKEFNEKIKEAEEKLEEARTKVEEIENPEWYILDRNSNAGYVSFIQDTKSVTNIGRVFPIVFFAVSVLISLTSMTRMVEEQRMQIGTLKALGYNNIQIMSKYILYATLASITGGILGMCVGFMTLPKILWGLYSTMYQIQDDVIIGFRWEIGQIGLIIIGICIIGATFYAVIKELKATPAILMRPKSPKMGNRVMLEKIPFIWKKLNFIQKVTVRNIFRYKKRFIMTIIGIFGCTSLIVTGFGIKDSITIILPNQYEKVFTYDLQINLKKEDEIQAIQENKCIEKVVETNMTYVKIKKAENEEDIQLVVPKDDFSGLININDVKTKENLELVDDNIYITDKVAQLLNIEEGDIVTLRDNDNNEYEIKIDKIVENYVSHYIYMTKSTYEKVIGKNYETNTLLTKNIELSEDDEEKLVEEFMEKDSITSITRTTVLMKTLDDTLKLLNYVVLILIVSAGLLAFVVLYNLANVNISERIRELATIKVLGFYDREVYDYVAREMTILTLIGIILGLFGGYCLNYFIIGTCEINILRFAKIIKPVSYIYSILITIVFTIIINIVTYLSLKKIDMIQSLKSIE